MIVKFDAICSNKNNTAAMMFIRTADILNRRFHSTVNLPALPQPDQPLKRSNVPPAINYVKRRKEREGAKMSMRANNSWKFHKIILQVCHTG
jgi:hypothetical protein